MDERETPSFDNAENQPPVVPDAQGAPEAQQPANPYGAPSAFQQASPYGASEGSQPENPYGTPASQPVNPYGTPAAQPANPYGSASGFQPTNPYGGAAAPQSANPYGAPSSPQQPASPYGAPTAQQPASPYGVPYAQPNGMPYGQPYPTEPAGTGKATGALVCGIFAILLSWVPLIGLILGIVAIVMAGSYLKQGGVRGSAKVGRVCGIVGIVFSVIAFVFSLMMGIAVINDLMDNDFSSSSYVPTEVTGSLLDDLLDEEERRASSVVNAEMDKIKGGDEDALALIAALSEEGFVNATDGLTMEECGIDSMEYARVMTQGFDYEVTMVLADPEDGDGFVAYEVTCRDIFDVLDKFNDSLYEESFSTMSEDQAKARIGELFMAAARAGDMEDGSYLSVDVVLEGGEWVIDEDSWLDEMDYFFGIY